MDKLEHYLDQVCGGIGPRSLRQHIRQELREHIEDAVAEHRAAGMADDAALDRALEDFGGSEQVRRELEATHGHRVMAVILDKAMQWKEKTMKAKWLWTSWAHVAAAGVIVVEVLFVVAAMIFVMPKVQEILLDADPDGHGLTSFMPSAATLLAMIRLVTDNGLILVILVAAAWTLFEWRVRNENKTMIRLSAMTTVAMALAVVVFFTAMVMVIPLAIAAPMLQARLPERIVNEELPRLNSAASALDQAVAGKDWNAIITQSNSAWLAARKLETTGGAAPAILSDQAKVGLLREQLKSTVESLRVARLAALDKNAGQLDAAMQQFHLAYRNLSPAPTTMKSE